MKTKPKTPAAENPQAKLQVAALKKENLRLQTKIANLEAANLTLENQLKIQAPIVLESNKRGQEEQKRASEALARMARAHGVEE